MDDEDDNKKWFTNVQKSDTGISVDIIPSDKISLRASSSHTNHNVRNLTDGESSTKWTSNYSTETYKDDLYTNRQITKGDYSRGIIVKDGKNRELLNDNQKKKDALRNKINSYSNAITKYRSYYDRQKKTMKRLEPSNYLYRYIVRVGGSTRIIKDVPVDRYVVRPISSTHVSDWSGEQVSVSIVSYGGYRYIRAKRINYHRAQDGWAADLRVPVYKIHWPSYYYWLNKERSSVERYNRIMDQNADSYKSYYNSRINNARQELNELSNVNINELQVSIINDGKYIGTKQTILANNSTINGEWIEVEIPETVVVKKYEILPGKRDGTNELTPFPKDFYILGANDTNKWEILDSHFDYKPVYDTDNSPISFNINNKKKYKYLRLVISSLNPAYTGFQGLGSASLSIFNVSGNRCYTLNKSCETFQSYSNKNNTMSRIEGLTMMDTSVEVLADLKEFNKKYQKYVKCKDITLPDSAKSDCTEADKNIQTVNDVYDKLMTTDGSIQNLKSAPLNRFINSADYETKHTEILQTHSEIIPLRKELDSKMKQLMDDEDNINADYKDKYDATMYSSLVLSVVLTSSLFFIFKKL
ncbi:hypothetical protein OAS95_02205 [Pelagibacteraceae bacterium]|nr:hypothetical protein [Pelagibacteraceae bacterium]